MSENETGSQGNVHSVASLVVQEIIWKQDDILELWVVHRMTVIHEY
ncbi:hypothetical protein [Ferruginibacter sp.]|nr:hypothetical protein [Ferruginibacter sp.]